MNFSSATKKWVKRKVVRSGFLRRCTGLLSAGAVILRYHSVQEDPRDVVDSIGDGITHSASLFTKQIEYIARYYNSISLDDLLGCLDGSRTFPARPVLVTFDDGFRDNAEVAVPILNRVGVPATFYVTAGYIESLHAPWYIRLRKAFYNSNAKSWSNPDSGETINLFTQKDREDGLVAACKHCARLAGQSQDEAVSAIERTLGVGSFVPEPSLMMTWEQIRKLMSQGHTIGSHTVSHPNIAHVTTQTLLAELKESKIKLEQHLKASVYHFSYPSPMLQPHWTGETVRATKKIGYKTATTCTPGSVRPGDNPLALKRMWVPFEMEEFIWYLDNTLLGRKL